MKAFTPKGIVASSFSACEITRYASGICSHSILSRHSEFVEEHADVARVVGGTEVVELVQRRLELEPAPF